MVVQKIRKRIYGRGEGERVSGKPLYEVCKNFREKSMGVEIGKKMDGGSGEDPQQIDNSRDPLQ